MQFMKQVLDENSRIHIHKYEQGKDYFPCITSEFSEPTTFITKNKDLKNMRGMIYVKDFKSRSLDNNELIANDDFTAFYSRVNYCKVQVYDVNTKELVMILFNHFSHVLGFNTNKKRLELFESFEQARDKGYVFNPDRSKRYLHKYQPDIYGRLAVSVLIKEPGLKNSKETIDYGFALQYNLEDNKVLSEFVRLKYDVFMDKVKVEKKYFDIARFIPNSFGIEYETCAGSLHPINMAELGLVPLRDGSVSAYEYTSIPMIGTKGLMSVAAQCHNLQKYCNFDSGCALHFHYQPKFETKEQVVAFYRLAVRLQDEIFKFYPNYKYDERGVMGKSKSYSTPLDEYSEDVFYSDCKENLDYAQWIEHQYEKLVQYITANNKKKEADKQGNILPAWNRKYHSPTRYTYINFVPLFTKTQKTIEFRRLEPTFDFTTIVSSMLIVAAMVEYTKEHAQLILEGNVKIRLPHVLDYHIRDVEIRTVVDEFIRVRQDQFLNIRKLANQIHSRNQGETKQSILRSEEMKLLRKAGSILTLKL